YTDAFCDEHGNITSNFPNAHWDCEFSSSGKGTIVKVDITFANEADMEKIIEMGFKEGFTAAHDNLDEVLAEKAAVRS
ncbi:MAG: SRPBCC domain-containing protein, partial [Bacteroidota bacterium]|nr:SRPBCC domain-containing protein [Bacteroidota bacterium]